MLDIDSFKRVNDALGHAAGDAVLKSLGELLRNYARSGDLIGRIGGEEFSILLPETSLEVAINVADRLHELVRAAAIEFDGNTLRYTVSMGIAAVDAGEETNREIAYLLRLADAGLYAAKQEGCNRTRMVPTSALSDRCRPGLRGSQAWPICGAVNSAADQSVLVVPDVGERAVALAVIA